MKGVDGGKVTVSISRHSNLEVTYSYLERISKGILKNLQSEKSMSPRN